MSSTNGQLLPLKLRSQMKNQYVGDINDYIKYSILRTLTASGLSPMHLGWMLTPDDSRSDGNLTGYLAQPERYRDYDPELFDRLCLILRPGGARSISLIEQSNLLAQTTYESALLAQGLSERAAYMERLRDEAAEAELLFMDPDNGLEIKSVPKGRKNSPKFLYFDEVNRLFATGASLLVYQHFPRAQREPYTQAQCRRLSTAVSGASILTIQSSRVLFALLLQERHLHLGLPLRDALQVRYGALLRATLRSPVEDFIAP